MQVDFHNHFRKQYKKLSMKIKEKFNERLIVFKNNPFTSELNNHTLHGKYSGCRSINVTGDIRAIYEVREKGVRFLDIDTHSNLYK
ncbi:type II toxin-antitoxin system mRNA interferase toxin, RelE/StbE family [Candidatus Nomurabacteria bacterium]|nr:type II toxin-antitoxin system mRNA interferase toxin, RelE/StbE family [Candidatus Nomurabacteria bacterium]